MDHITVIGLGAYAVLVGFLIGFGFARDRMMNIFEKALLERKLAQYDPQTGKLKWLDGSDVP